jgi:transcriptional regulator with XRE-family HTH domain
LETIGERIKFRREQLQLSQEDLAKMLGYKSRSSINKIEIGCQNLTQSKIKAIADALQTTPSYIMGWEEHCQGDSAKIETTMLPAPPIDTQIAKEYGEKTLDDLHLYLRLDAEDRGEVRGTMKQLLKSEKYTTEAPSK